MRDSTTQKVTLDGADKIKAALTDLAKFGKDAFSQIGKTGKDAFDQIGKSVGDVGKGAGVISNTLTSIGTAGTTAFGQIRQAAASVGSAELTAGLNSVSTALNDVGARSGELARISTSLAALGNLGRGLLPTLGTVGVLVGSVMALKGALAAVGAASADTAAKIMDTAKSAGMTTEAYQRFVLAGEAAGLSSEQIASGLAAITKATADAAAGSTVLGANFRKVGDAAQGITTFYAGAGVSVTRFGSAIKGAGANAEHFRTVFDGVQRNVDSTTDYIKKLSAAIDAMPEGAQKTKILEDLGKKFGDEFVQSLSQISSGLDETGDRFDKLGLKLSEADEAAVTAQQTSLARVKTALDNQGSIISNAVKAMRLQIGLIFTPLATAAQDSISDFIDEHKTAIQDFIGNYITPAIRATKEFITSLFAEGGAMTYLGNAFSEQWGRIKTAALFAWDAIVYGAGLAWAAVLKFMEIANGAATVINSMFGTNFTGATLLATVLFYKLISSLEIIPGWLRVITGLFLPFVGAFTVVTPIMRAFGAALDWVNGKAGDAGRGLHDYFANLISSTFPGLSSVFSKTMEGASDSMDAVRLVFRVGMDYVKALLFGSKETQAQAWDLLKDVTKGAWETIKQTIATAWADVKKLIGIDGIISEFHRFEATIERIAVLLQGLSLKNLWDSVKGSAAGAADAVKGAVKGAADYVMGGLSPPPPAMVPAFAGGGAGGGARTHAGEVAFTLNIDGMRTELFGVEEAVANLKRAAADNQSSKTLKNNPSWDR
jgi:hypothetical protein